MTEIRVRLAFHLALIVATGTFLFAYSVPGFMFRPALISGGLLLMLGIAWLILIGVAAVTKRWTWWFIAAPLVVVLTAGLQATKAPLHAPAFRSWWAYDGV